MWQLTACKISVSFSLLNRIKNETNFYRISELMLAPARYTFIKNAYWELAWLGILAVFSFKIVFIYLKVIQFRIRFMFYLIHITISSFLTSDAK